MFLQSQHERGTFVLVVYYVQIVETREMPKYIGMLLARLFCAQKATPCVSIDQKRTRFHSTPLNSSERKTGENVVCGVVVFR